MAKKILFELSFKLLLNVNKVLIINADEQFDVARCYIIVFFIVIDFTGSICL